jgi:hypothetical protein
MRSIALPSNVVEGTFNESVIQCPLTPNSIAFNSNSGGPQFNSGFTNPQSARGMQVVLRALDAHASAIAALLGLVDVALCLSVRPLRLL